MRCEEEGGLRALIKARETPFHSPDVLESARGAMKDLYAKILLTVIALALLVLVLKPWLATTALHFSGSSEPTENTLMSEPTSEPERTLTWYYRYPRQTEFVDDLGLLQEEPTEDNLKAWAKLNLEFPGHKPGGVTNEELRLFLVEKPTKEQQKRRAEILERFKTNRRQ
jgi:hypothetical protein